MSISKQSTLPRTLEDSILAHREAFKKPAHLPEFPPIIDPDYLEAKQTPLASSFGSGKMIAEAQPAKKSKSLIPRPVEAPKDPKIENPYVYAGAKGKKRLDWEEVDHKDALPAVVIEEQRNQLEVEVAKAKAKRSSIRGELSQRSKIILESLPVDERPMAIVTGFPHIMNLISNSWHEPKAFVQTLDDLLIDDRGNRAGFPFAVISELTQLRELYFSTIRPEARRLWDRM